MSLGTQLPSMGVSLLFSVTACAGMVEDWNAAVVVAVKQETLPPSLASRHFAMIHLAMWRAYSEMEDQVAAAGEAANEAAWQTSLTLLPASRRAFEILRQQYQATHVSQEGMEAGRKAAAEVLQWRRDDGASTTVPYIPHTEPGQWRRTANGRPPESPHWGKVKPFLLPGIQAFLPGPPPALDSAAYSEGWQRVYAEGAAGSSTRTGEQTLLARFWSDFSYTSTPPGHWNAIARDLSATRKLTITQSCALFATLNIALADAGIVCFYTKYRDNFWRPETAIHNAANDGNEATAPFPDWKPLLSSPPHPEYISGHSCFSGAAAEVLHAFFPGQAVPFHAGSDALPGVERTYHDFFQCAAEISESRVWGGIHFPFSTKAGLETGRKVGRYCVTHAPGLRSLKILCNF